MMRDVRYIAQGDMAIGSRDGEVISTILGSCVSACIWDPVARVGGMNHMLLPMARAGDADVASGAVEMERLINGILARGGERGRLRVKLFGGASMLKGRTDIGAQNARFAETYLQSEGLGVEAQSLGGTQARQIRFWPTTGDVKQRFVREQPVTRLTLTPASGGDLEMF